MKKILFVILIVILVAIPNYTYCTDNDTDAIIKEQQESFGIYDFINNAEKYSDSVFDDINMKDILNSAIKGEVDNSSLIKKIITLIGREITYSIKTLIGILVIVLIHTILRTITDGLRENSVSKIIYYVQYILIISLIVSNFSDILQSITNTINNLVGFIHTLIPLLVTLMIYTGSITTSTMIEPIIIFVIQFVANIINNLILPVISIMIVFIIVSKISDQIQINKLTKFLKSSIVWFLGIVLTLFVGILSLEGSLTSSVDGITAKTTKAVVSNLIPVVGKILGDSVDTVLGCGHVLKNAVGFVGTIVVIGICIIPIIKLATLSIMYSLTSSIVEPLADSKIVKLLEEISGVFKLLLSIVCSVSVLLIIGITLIIKISNSGMMYR